MGEIDRLYDDPEWPAWNFCLVDLNYTATPERAQEQSFYALQVTLPCSRIWEGQSDNLTYTSLCYNHYHPEYFSSISETGVLLPTVLSFHTVLALSHSVETPCSRYLADTPSAPCRRRVGKSIHIAQVFPPHI